MAYSPRQVIPRHEAGDIRMQLKDGSVWRTGVDGSGNLILIEQLEAPTGGSSSAAVTIGGVGGLAPPLAPKPSPKKEEEKEPSPKEARKAQEMRNLDDIVFRQQIASIMRDNKFDRKLKGQKRGKLDMKRLWKVPAGYANVFEQKKERKNKEYNIMLVVDESGSMAGEKARMAADVTVTLATAFEKIGISYAVVGFNRFIMEHKSFDEKIDLAKLHETITVNADGHPGGGDTGRGHNNDYDALAYSYPKFKGRKGNNLMVFLSDGRPAPDDTVYNYFEDAKGTEADMASNPRSYAYRSGKPDPLGKTHKYWIDKKSESVGYEGRTQEANFHHLVNGHREEIPTIGIGIMSECWQIPNHIAEYDIEKLKPLIVSQIRKNIKRG